MAAFRHLRLLGLLVSVCMIVQVALPVPLRQLFDYTVPDESLAQLKVGCRVQVPFGKRTLTGLVWHILAEPSSDIPLKAIQTVIDDHPVIDASLMDLLSFAADYYHHPIGDVCFSALPALLREGRAQTAVQSRQLVALADGETDSLKRAPKQLALWQQLQQGPILDSALVGQSALIQALIDKQLASWQLQPLQPFTYKAGHQAALPLNPAQALAVATIKQAAGQFQRLLIEGVTGSGKTEVYLQAIEPFLQQQRQVLVLVPEIGLTPQTLSRFSQRFAVPMQVWHSAMTDHERLAAWQASQQGAAAITIGTRSALFLPFQKLGLIVIDEEHDQSLKQQEGFRYHARDLAIKRAAQLQCPVVLGSATPSLESLHNALQGRFQHLQLPDRATNARLPRFELIDLKQQVLTHGLASGTIHQARQHLQRGEQVMLFLNRRGFAPALICHECGWLTECRRCSAYMTYHKQSRQMVCHHCGLQQPIPRQCGDCGSTQLVPVGQGTEQLEEQLQQLFPEYAVLRLDRDSTRRKGALQQALGQIADGDAQLIIGTQMLAKGHHFPNVSLVVIVDVDGALYSHDFRAPEQLAQLITQVAGRAGRAQIPGKVLLQTHYPGHPVLQDIIHNGYSSFARSTLLERQQTQLPPWLSMAVFRTESLKPEAGCQLLQHLAERLKQSSWPIQLLGPIQPPLEKRAGMYRWQLQLFSADRKALHQAIEAMIADITTHPLTRQLKWQLDVDPIDLS